MVETGWTGGSPTETDNGQATPGNNKGRGSITPAFVYHG
jgi:hypothetical protein